MSDLLATTSFILTVPTASQTGPWGGYKKNYKHSRSLNSFLLPVALQPPEVSINQGPEQALRALTDSSTGRIPNRSGNRVLKKMLLQN